MVVPGERGDLCVELRMWRHRVFCRKWRQLVSIMTEGVRRGLKISNLRQIVASRAEANGHVWQVEPRQVVWLEALDDFGHEW